MDDVGGDDEVEALGLEVLGSRVPFQIELAHAQARLVRETLGGALQQQPGGIGEDVLLELPAQGCERVLGRAARPAADLQDRERARRALRDLSQRGADPLLHRAKGRRCGVERAHEPIIAAGEQHLEGVGPSRQHVGEFWGDVLDEPVERRIGSLAILIQNFAGCFDGLVGDRDLVPAPRGGTDRHCNLEKPREQWPMGCEHAGLLAETMRRAAHPGAEGVDHAQCVGAGESLDRDDAVRVGAKFRRRRKGGLDRGDPRRSDRSVPRSVGLELYSMKERFDPLWEACTRRSRDRRKLKPADRERRGAVAGVEPVEVGDGDRAAAASKMGRHPYGRDPWTQHAHRLDGGRHERLGRPEAHQEGAGNVERAVQ